MHARASASANARARVSASARARARARATNLRPSCRHTPSHTRRPLTSTHEGSLIVQKCAVSGTRARAFAHMCVRVRVRPTSDRLLVTHTRTLVAHSPTPTTPAAEVSCGRGVVQLTSLAGFDRASSRERSGEMGRIVACPPPPPPPPNPPPPHPPPHPHLTTTTSNTPARSETVDARHYSAVHR
ncbi:hypothetical protein T492DRAFT_465718 [Pavlovales sp. CCMP2436]|nr:hypothetical protein T492DRAFT_465718 [Pavlovales sp. CCMP2436]